MNTNAQYGNTEGEEYENNRKEVHKMEPQREVQGN